MSVLVTCLVYGTCLKHFPSECHYRDELFKILESADADAQEISQKIKALL